MRLTHIILLVLFSGSIFAGSVVGAAHALPHSSLVAQTSLAALHQPLSADDSEPANDEDTSRSSFSEGKEHEIAVFSRVEKRIEIFSSARGLLTPRTVIDPGRRTSPPEVKPPSRG